MSDNDENMNVRVEWPTIVPDARIVNYFSVLNSGTQQNGFPEPLIYLVAAHVAPPILPDEDRIKRFVEGGATVPAEVAATLVMPVDRAEELAGQLLGQVAAYRAQQGAAQGTQS